MRVLALAATLILAAASPSVALAASADEIIARHVAATGGSDAHAGLNNVRMRVEIVEPAFTVIGNYRAAADDRMRIDIEAGGKIVFSEGIDSKGAWQQDGEGAKVTDTSTAGHGALQHGIDFNVHGLGKFKARGHDVAHAGRERIDGTDYDVLDIRMKDGFRTRLLLNTATSMIERRRDVRALHPDIDQTKLEIESVYSDFTPLCGVLQAQRSKQVEVATGKVLQTTRLLTSSCNLPEPELGFDRPSPASSG